MIVCSTIAQLVSTPDTFALGRCARSASMAASRGPAGPIHIGASRGIEIDLRSSWPLEPERTQPGANADAQLVSACWHRARPACVADATVADDGSLWRGGFVRCAASLRRRIARTSPCARLLRFASCPPYARSVSVVSRHDDRSFRNGECAHRARYRCALRQSAAQRRSQRDVRARLGADQARSFGRRCALLGSQLSSSPRQSATSGTVS